ncbi:hypothetical protein M422DRAFT_255470 [Sphaerobolus stellatus SS14]|uniref:Uncharacterized protein n=1 Tax=Sphaerobolus stellatus (strain SS14) TaxID=990650 RepID=A0A0C9VJ21_SPHS4|nr:hypothetical protein M422DRAFT_255470 [Sphaerobolus stellatus SS14]
MFRSSMRNDLDSTDNWFQLWFLWARERDSRGILRMYIAGDGGLILSLIEAPSRTNSSQQDIEDDSIGAVVCAYSKNYISENILRQIECQEEGKLEPLTSREDIISSLRALFHIIPYFWAVDTRAPHLGGLYHYADNGWDQTPMGKEPFSIFPLESHHCHCDNWTTRTNPEPAEWQARTRMARGIRLKFDLSPWPDRNGPLYISFRQSLTPSKIHELLHASMAQLCYFKGRLEDSFQGKCNSRNSQSICLVTDLEWMVKVWKPVKRPNPPAVSELYLFIDDPVIPHSQGAGPKVPEAYWSKCPDGTTRVTTLELYALGIEHAPVVWYTTVIMSLQLDLVDMLQDFYQSCGLNPFSNEVSNLLELPLPQHVKLAYQQKPSHRDKILQANEIGFELVWYNFNGGMASLIPFISDYLPEEYQLLQEFNRRLGTKVAKYWAFMAAPELLPDSLKLYDLRTTGHDFDSLIVYADSNQGINSFYFTGSHTSLTSHKPTPQSSRPRLRYLTERPETAHSRTYDPARLFGITTLNVVRAARFLSGIEGTDPAQTPVSPSSADSPCA